MRYVCIDKIDMNEVKSSKCLNPAFAVHRFKKKNENNILWVLCVRNAFRELPSSEKLKADYLKA